MNISTDGINLIKQFEGCYLEAYLCPGNVWTIGYGTTEPINGVKPYKGMKITQEQADKLLITNLKKYENAVNTYVKYNMNQNMFDALVSFTYNCGISALQKSTLLQKLNKGDIQGAADEFLRWNKSGGKILNGLVKRRKKERELFLKDSKTTIVVEPVKIEISINGKKREVDAVNIGGYNYIKMRDIEDDLIKVDFIDNIPCIIVGRG